MVCIILRYTSIQPYKNVIRRLSLTIFLKISNGKIDTFIYAQALKMNGKISEDICLLFGEMYFKKKCETYFGGEQVGSYENGKLYKELSIPWFL